VRFSNFWKWQNRAKIFIYPTHASYIENTQRPRWSHGFADYKNKKIISYNWGKGFVENLLSHEIAHLIFRDYVGFKGKIPLWLDEGVAQWAEGQRKRTRRILIKRLVKAKKILSISDMMGVDVGRIASDDIVQINSAIRDGENTVALKLKGKEFVDIYYLQAYSLIDFLINEYGTDNFTIFCRQLRDGKNIDAALSNAYTNKILDLNDLQKKWVKFVIAQ